MAGLFLSRRRLAPHCGIGASLLEVGPGPSPRVKKCLSLFFVFLHCDIGLVVETFLVSHGLRFQRRIDRESVSGTLRKKRAFPLRLAGSSIVASEPSVF